MPDTTTIARFPAWILMWALATAIFAVCKGLVFAHAPPGGGWRRAAFLFAWPGMDANDFLHGTARATTAGEWIGAGAKTIVGGVLVFWGARRFTHPIAAGWAGMTGVIFMLHFGGFHLLSLAWRAAGVGADPIMRWPVAAQSLGDFWGRRWNLAFNELAERFVFRPCSRRFGPGPASVAAFVASGAIHELVISLPAGGGWGLPTGYFLVQGLGLAFERSRAGRRFGLRRGWRGRGFALIVAAGPAFWLFPPLFIHHVILPMMRDIGAL